MARFAVVAIAALCAAGRAQAVPAYLQMWKARYHPPAASCLVCHGAHAGGKVNDYGREFVKAGASWEAFTAIEPRDSDGDGAANLKEIMARANPGDAASTVRAPGRWLAGVTREESMPLEALARLFPGISRFDVKEVELSGADAAAVGKRLGGALSRGDRFWTLYFPVDVRVSPPARVGVAVFPAAPLSGGLFLGSVALGADGRVRSAWGGIFGETSRDDLSALGRQLAGKSAEDPLEIGKDLTGVPGREAASVAGAREFRKSLLVVARVLRRT